MTRLQVLQQRVLGNGSFGVIVLGSDNQGGADVAVKMASVCLRFSRVVRVIESFAAAGLQGAAAAARGEDYTAHTGWPAV